MGRRALRRVSALRIASPLPLAERASLQKLILVGRNRTFCSAVGLDVRERGHCGKDAKKETDATRRARGGRRADSPGACRIDHWGAWLRDLLGGKRPGSTCPIRKWRAH